MGKYASGRKFEYRVRDAFRELGYVVVRCAGSKGPFDLVAIGAVRTFFVQCKGHNRALPMREWNALIDIAEPVNATPVVARRAGRKLQFFQLMDRKVLLRKSPWSLITIYANPVRDLVRTAVEARHRPSAGLRDESQRPLAVALPEVLSVS